MSVFSPLLARFERFTRLAEEERQLVHTMTGLPLRRLDACQDIMAEGEQARTVPVILEGWACRHKYLADGRRHIIAFLLPGDICSQRAMLDVSVMDHAISTLTDVRFVELAPEQVRAALEASPGLRRAFAWDAIVSAAIQSEGAVSLGRRTAVERVAHIFCELVFRLRAANIIPQSEFVFPLTQADLADAVGLSTVHVNRTVQELRGRELVRWTGKRVTVLDLPGLMQLALFNPSYLHLTPDRAESA